MTDFSIDSSLYPDAYAARATWMAFALLANGPFEPQNQPLSVCLNGI
jgi:hypothetical protein